MNNAADIIDGGANTDTLSIGTTGTVAAFAGDVNLLNVENITFTTDAMVMNLNNQTEALNVTTANGTNGVTFGGTAANKFTGGTGADTLTLTQAALAAAGTSTGGTGANVIALNAASTGIVDANFANMSLFQTLTLTGASTAVLATNAAATGIANVTLGAGNTDITSANAIAVNAAALTGQTLAIQGAGAFTVTGHDSTGTLTKTSTAATDITLAARATGTLALGADTTGTDAITADALLDTEVLTMTGANDATVALVAGDLSATTYTGALTVTATSGTNVIATGSGIDTITGGGGADTLSGGAGLDTYVALTDVASANGIDAITMDTVDGSAISGDIFNFTASAAFIGTTTEDIVVVNDADVEAGADAFGAAGDNIIILTGDFAADAAALSALTFDGFGGFDTGQALMIYSSSGTADARIAVVDVAAGGDISGAVDMVTLVGVTVVEASTGFGNTDFVLD